MQLGKSIVQGLFVLFVCGMAFAAEPVTIVFDQPETAGISGFRWMWNEPVVLSADGPTQLVDHGHFGKAPSAIWATQPHNFKHGQIPLRDEDQPGALVFDAVHRSMLVRFPNAAEKTAEQLAKGFEIQKVELALPFKATELWPEGYHLPSGMSFLGDQWAKSTPRWHAIAWALRRPWTAESKTGPTFNAWMNGAGYWTHYGAQDTESDRFPHRFGPTEVSEEHPQERMDMTALLQDAEFGDTLADRLRTLAHCGFIVRKWETYDAALWQGGYEWQTARGPQGILIDTPRLVVTFAPGRAQTIERETLALDIDAYVAEMRRKERLGEPTAVLHTEEEFARLSERLGFRQPDWMPDWQWRRVQEVHQFGGGRSFPTDMQQYHRWLDDQLAIAPRAWRGFDATESAQLYFRYYDALPEPVRDHWKLYWQAWLMPHREASEIVSYWAGAQAQEYYQRTRDWRGNFSVYRTYCYAMGTMNFNHWATAGTLLGGAIVGSERLIADGRHGLEQWPLRTWSWYDGSTQESIDHYYFAHSLVAQKVFADFGPELLDRMMGQSTLGKSVEELASAYHPGLRRFISSSGRTGIAYLLGIQDALQAIMHTLSPAGAYTDLGGERVNAPNVENMPVISGTPGLVAQQTLNGTWGPEWMASIADEKELPYEMTVNYMVWGAYRATPLWRRTFMGRNYGMASQDISAGNESVPAMAQWRRKDRKAESMTDLGTLIMRPGINRTELLDSIWHGTGNRNPNGSVGTQGSNMATLQHRNRMIVLASPTEKLDYSAGRPLPDEITSLQMTIGLMRFTEEPMEIYVDDQRVETFPHRFPYGKLITIKDGVSYIGIIPIPSGELERGIDVEIVDDGEMTEMQGGGNARETLRINAYMMHLDKPLKREAIDDELWRRIFLTYGGYVIEMGDETEYENFDSFRRHIGAAQLQTRWEGDANTLHVSYAGGDDIMECGYRTDYTGGWGKQVPTNQCFPYRRVNGEWPYLPEGINRDTTATIQGTTGRLEKNGAVLELGEGTMGYLIAMHNGTVAAYNPFPDATFMTLTLPGGGSITADGQVGLTRIIYEPERRRLDVGHAARPADADRADMATALLVLDVPQLQEITVNGEAVNAVPVQYEGKHGFAVPLRDAFQRDEFIDRYRAAQRAKAASAELDVRDTLIQDWYIVGPFPHPYERFETAYAPEQGPVNLQDVYEGADGVEVSWKRILAAGQPPLGSGGMVNLLPHFTPNEWMTAYAFTRVISDRDRKATLLAGSDDSLKIWVNGENVHANKAYRAVKLDDDRVDIQLREGENSILMKIDQAGGGWGFVARLVDEWGLPLTGDGIKYGFE